MPDDDRGRLPGDMPSDEDIFPPELDEQTKRLLREVFRRQLAGVVFSMVLIGTDPSSRETDTRLTRLEAEVAALDALTDELDLDLRRRQQE